MFVQYFSSEAVFLFNLPAKGVPAATRLLLLAALPSMTQLVKQTPTLTI